MCARLGGSLSCPFHRTADPGADLQPWLHVSFSLRSRGNQGEQREWESGRLTALVTGDLWEFLLSVGVSRANRAAHPSPANPALKQGSSWHADRWGMVRFMCCCDCDATK